MEKGGDWDEVVIPQELQDCASGTSKNDRYGTDPRLYDWCKWEEDLDAVEGFFEQELYAKFDPDAEGGGEGVRTD
ncbi:hypothetical protein C8A01DRAFT_40061 [Parachaetomium inaequale]|uniref:Uncharacterized protein n=1 Tax=Parachaetomium inaequale TaxID=2588326 RepID=A0AAN6SN85_9PEZI|nr:hypothetical protein C8A01DRAFT_40061 [Parachaetomium inaequale]